MTMSIEVLLIADYIERLFLKKIADTKTVRFVMIMGFLKML